MKQTMLWIDDHVAPPSVDYIWAKDLGEAFKQVFLNKDVTHVSFDHDMGMFGGKPVDTQIIARMIEDLASKGLIRRLTWDIHSQNPVGRDALYATLSRADGYWNQQE